MKLKHDELLSCVAVKGKLRHYMAALQMRVHRARDPDTIRSTSDVLEELMAKQEATGEVAGRA